MAYMEFEDSEKGRKERKRFWLSGEGINLICGWRREGMDINEICFQKLGVAWSTLDRWRKESLDLQRGLAVSQDGANAHVEASLFKRAVGYDYDETTEELVEGSMRITKVVHKHVVPDTKACLSWLFSRRPDRWRAYQDPIDPSAKDIEAAREVMVTIEATAISAKSENSERKSEKRTE